jgi:hypothetical protein
MSKKKSKIVSIQNVSDVHNRYDLTVGNFSRYFANGILVHNTDGQNVFATIQSGEVKFARNKTELKNPMSLGEFQNKFEGHPSKLVQDTFQFAASDLATLLIKLPSKIQDETFQNGLNFMNMELIYSQNPNVIHYDVDVIQFHGVKKTDGDGNIIGDDNSAAKGIAGVLKSLNANVGKVFTIIPPQIIKLQKDVDFEANRSKFLGKLNVLKDRYNLTDADEVARYHEMWWREQIENLFSEYPQDVKEGLLLRWAYDDKKTLNLRSLDKVLTKDQSTAIKKFDKEDFKSKFKENIRPFEDLFLELGSVILKNASNFVAASPDKEMQRLHTEIRTSADKIKLNGDLSQIEKVASELERLQRIGGIESIIPTEGVVFSYKGKMYKLTGTFAAINSLLGIIKYGR